MTGAEVVDVSSKAKCGRRSVGQIAPVILAYDLVLDRLREHNCRPRRPEPVRRRRSAHYTRRTGKDTTPSLSVTANGGKVLIHCHGECETSEILAGMGSSNSRRPAHRTGRTGPLRTVIAEYPYTDETGKVLYVKVRYDPQGLPAVRAPAQRRPWRIRSTAYRECCSTCPSWPTPLRFGSQRVGKGAP